MLKRGKLLRCPTGDLAKLLMAMACVSSAEADSDVPVVDQVIAVDSEAEPAAPGPTAPPRQAGGMQEILVTAQKREESLQDVPISIQAFSSDMLDDKGIDEPKALQQLVPGMQYNAVAGFNQIYIRGVGVNVIIPSVDASVATYIDGIYYTYGQNLAMALGVVERVEVLKGPQGTLFGRNSTGGAINVVTRQPSATRESSVLISRESYDKTNVRVYTNLPLTDELSWSVSGLHYSEESYYRLSNSSRESLPEETSRGFATKLGWRPSESFSAVLGYTYSNLRGALGMLLPTAEPTPLGTALGVRAEPDYRTSNDGPSYIDSRVGVYSGDFKAFTSWFDIRLIAARQRIRSPAGYDADTSGQPLVFGNIPGQRFDAKTAELQFTSNDSSWENEWLTWVAGVYHLESNGGFDPYVLSVAPGLLTYLANPGEDSPLAPLGGLASPLIGLLGAVSGPGGIAQFLDNGLNVTINGVLDTQSTAGFVQATAKLSDRIDLTLGGRYQSETRKLTESRVGFRPIRFDANFVVPVTDFGAQSTDASNFSPKVVLDFKATDHSLVYLSYSKGYKSGSYNIVNILRPGTYIKPEVVTAYELGYKDTVLDGNLRFNGALFQNDIRNAQVESIALISGGVVQFDNAKKSRIRGADFDLLWLPFPRSIPGIQFNLGACYLDGVYTDFENGSGYDDQTGLAFDGTVFPHRDFSGNRTARTPKYSGNAGLTYAFELGSGEVEMAADAYYNGGSYFTAQNRESVREDAYTVLNARLGYFYPPWNVRVTAFGKNITSAEYHHTIQEIDFATLKLLAPPATYGVRLNWEF